MHSQPLAHHLLPPISPVICRWLQRFLHPCLAPYVQTLSLPPHVDTNSHPSQEHVSFDIGSAATNSTTGQPRKCKPSRCADTAKRRATHNAVNCARRETMNSWFLDLIALLPNLSPIRRLSKSSIVNSAIRRIHASRRHRLLAARELYWSSLKQASSVVS
ncbi:hypothetical protein BDW22DRAFT_30418 [Trametopsis cervina]|nr:hypothetical protein BDW22DRAFT_30418 [Trametopsis cervina]